MEELDIQFKNVKISKRKRDDKKYLISEESRKKLKSINKKFIIIIPYYSIIPKITDESKQLFIYTINIITDIYNNLLFIDKDLNDELTNSKTIKEYITSHFNLKSIKNDCINKLLEVENKKILVYSVNLGKKIKIINNFLITNDKERRRNKMESNLDLNLRTQYFRKKTFINFYKDIDNNQFDKNINNYVYQQLNKLNIYDDINIEFRNSIFFNHL